MDPLLDLNEVIVKLDARPVISTETSHKPWTLIDAIEFCRLVESVLSVNQYHVALGGGVLLKGQSNKDLDIFIYPHNTLHLKRKNKILTILETIGVKVIQKLDFHGYDKKWVYQTEYLSKRVDIFFVK